MNKYRVTRINENNLGTLTILINDDEKTSWFIVKEICSALKTKKTSKDLERIISPCNIIKMRSSIHRINEEYSSYLWPSEKDHADKYIINKYGVLQLICSLKNENINNILKDFIDMTFRNVNININSAQTTNNELSELDKQRLRLFSSDDFEVADAHKRILKLELESRRLEHKETDVVKQQKEQIESLNLELNESRNENNRLKNRLGEGADWYCIRDKEKEWINRFGHKPNANRMTDLSYKMKIYPKKDVPCKDKNGIDRKVNRYHVSVWGQYEFEEINAVREKENQKALPNLDIKALPIGDE